MSKVLPGIPEDGGGLRIDFADLLEPEVEREDPCLGVLEDLPVLPFLHKLAGKGRYDNPDGYEDVEERKTRGIQPDIGRSVEIDKAEEDPPEQDGEIDRIPGVEIREQDDRQDIEIRVYVIVPVFQGENGDQNNTDREQRGN